MDRNRAFDYMIRASELVENAEAMTFYSMSSKGSFIEIAMDSIDSAIKQLEEAKKYLGE